MPMKFDARIKNQEEAIEFTEIAQQFDNDIDVCYRHYVLDAKSYLGLASIDFTQPVIVDVHGVGDSDPDVCNAFAKFIEKGSSEHVC